MYVSVQSLELFNYDENGCHCCWWRTCENKELVVVVVSKVVVVVTEVVVAVLLMGIRNSFPCNCHNNLHSSSFRFSYVGTARQHMWKLRDRHDPTKSPLLLILPRARKLKAQQSENEHITPESPEYNFWTYACERLYANCETKTCFGRRHCSRSCS